MQCHSQYLNISASISVSQYHLILFCKGLVTSLLGALVVGAVLSSQVPSDDNHHHDQGHKDILSNKILPWYNIFCNKMSLTHKRELEVRRCDFSITNHVAEDECEYDEDTSSHKISLCTILLAKEEEEKEKEE